MKFKEYKEYAIRKPHSRKQRERFFISGPISGLDDYEIAFEQAEMDLVLRGYTTVNPVRLAGAMPEDANYEELMAICIRLIDMCDGVYMLNGWRDSLGANREYGYARGKGKKIILQEDE